MKNQPKNLEKASFDNKEKTILEKLLEIGKEKRKKSKTFSTAGKWKEFSENQ